MNEVEPTNVPAEPEDSNRREPTLTPPRRQRYLDKMPPPLPTRLISGGSVCIGTHLAYLGRPFTVVRVERAEDHPTLGRRWIAYDDKGRGIMVYEDYTATVVV